MLDDVAKPESVREAVLSRRAVRAFRDREGPPEVLERVLDAARFAPSGCNFQAWEATIIAGTPLRELQARIVSAAPQDPVEYVIQPVDLPQPYLDRLRENGERQHRTQGIRWEDRAAWRAFLMRDYPPSVRPPCCCATCRA